MNRPALTPAYCAANGIIITRYDEKAVYFGLLDVNDTILQKRIKKTYPGFQCVFIKLEPDSFNLKLSQLFSEEQPPDSEAISSGGSRESIIDKIADDAPVVNLLNSIFLEAISKRTSDIHIESGSNQAAIRFRIDGLLVTVKIISQERAIAVSARLKILANLNVLENRRPQDGHIDVRTDSYSLDVRISIIPTIWGESIVLRLLNRSDSPFSLDSLGFSVLHKNLLQNIKNTRAGLILVTGPTGSGKTTTLTAILKELNTGDTKIISIEDPVEYRTEGITQIQVHEELRLTFDAMLRRIFRQDPDIIMIGEIRDIETAELAVRAALTGHLVLATLHTNNAVEAVCRLQNMGIPAYMVAAVLRMVIAQRLIRKLCPECRTKGCNCCSNAGYWGRTVAAEFIEINIELSGMIANGAVIEQLRSYLQKNDFKTIYDDAEEKAAAGISTEGEIQRELGAKQ
jgi:general secretion pathway protein E/type IV pilus assembly protein PilB